MFNKQCLTIIGCCLFDQSQQQAASTTVYCATANELTGISGQYYNNCYLCEPSKLSQSESLGLALWEHSEALIERIFAAPPL